MFTCLLNDKRNSNLSAPLLCYINVALVYTNFFFPVGVQMSNTVQVNNADTPRPALETYLMSVCVCV